MKKLITTEFGYVHAHRFVWAKKEDIENTNNGLWIITRSPNGSLMERSTLDDSIEHCIALDNWWVNIRHWIKSKWLSIDELSGETVQGFSDELIEEIQAAIAEKTNQP
jgi:hypothetical protein